MAIIPNTLPFACLVLLSSALFFCFFTKISVWFILYADHLLWLKCICSLDISVF